MSFSELIMQYAAQRSSFAADRGKTLRANMKPVIKHLGDRPMKNILASDLEDYISARMDAGYAATTVRAETQVAVGALKLAATRGWRSWAPKPTLPRIVQREKRALTPDEAQALYKAAKHPVCARFIAIALATGARATAITDLTWDRVDVARRTIDFRAPIFRAERRKTRPIVAVSDELLTIIGARKPNLAGPVIDLTPQYIYRLVRDAALRAGLGDDVTPHTLRRTAATALVKSLSVSDAQKMLGHRLSRVTETFYVKLGPDDLRKAIEANAPLISSLTEMNPAHGPVQENTGSLVFHITDKETGSMIEKISQSTGLPPAAVIKVACQATLTSLAA